ncbi:MAG: quinone-dependent dihydroorotate dehydrogenase [Balneolales bacterium]|nr:quinone-dependent dihydroorotate dehydrogenase [Balneolales bacterium]
MIYESLIRPLLFRMDAEKAHDFAFAQGQKIQQYDAALALIKDLCKTENTKGIYASGIHFPNPVGLAAGFDKNARLLPLLEALGFGFVEIGSITADPSSGNPKPRMFRLAKDEAVINRMGLNNAGASAILHDLEQTISGHKLRFPVGVNIAKTPGKGKSTEDAIQDYFFSAEKAMNCKNAAYITLNISCPNSGDGKSFEDPALFKELANKVFSGITKTKPVFIKFSADTSEDVLYQLIDIALEAGSDGFVAVNTTTQRNELQTAEGEVARAGKGGLSGKPLRENALKRTELIRKRIPDDKTLISVGGISSAQDAAERLDAGAQLIQLYTSLVYKGPFLIRDINKGLEAEAWS